MNRNSPIGKIVRNEAGQISIQKLDGSAFDISAYVNEELYVTPDLGGQLNITSAVQKAFGWDKIYATLTEVAPGWNNGDNTSVENAIATIKMLKRVNTEWESLYQPIDELVRPHTKLGESVIGKAVELIKAQLSVQLVQTAVPDDFLQKLGVWYAKLTNCDAVADDGEHVGYCCPIAMMDEFEFLLSAAPTPPSAETCKMCNGHGLIGGFNGQDYDSDICPECNPVEQPDSAAPEPVIAQAKNANGWVEVPMCAAIEFEKENFASVRYLYEHPPTKPQRITEQDAQKLALSTLRYWTQVPNGSVEGWFDWHGRTLLAKLNERREPDYKAENAIYLSALKELACLGNGDRYGNSEGNVIAQRAIAKHEGGNK